MSDDTLKPTNGETYRVEAGPPEYMVGYGFGNMFTVVCRASYRPRAEQIAQLLTENDDQKQLLATHGELFRQLGKIVFSAERNPLCLTELVNAVEKLKEERDGLNVVNRQIKDENGTLRQRESVLLAANAELREENNRQAHLIQQLTKSAGFAPEHAPASAAEAIQDAYKDGLS